MLQMIKVSDILTKQFLLQCSLESEINKADV